MTISPDASRPVQQFGTLYLNRYAIEVAYGEDASEKPDGAIFAAIFKPYASAHISSEICGYCTATRRKAGPSSNG